MTEALVAADLHLALDVLADLTTEVALDPQVSIDDAADLRDLVVGEVTHTRGGVDTGGVADVDRNRPADAIDVGEADAHLLVSGDVYAANACHVSALPLLVTRVFADDHDAAVSADDTALVTDLLDAGSNLHVAPGRRSDRIWWPEPGRVVECVG